MKIEEMMQDCIKSIQALQYKINCSTLRALDEGPHLLEVDIFGLLSMKRNHIIMIDIITYEVSLL